MPVQWGVSAGSWRQGPLPFSTVGAVASLVAETRNEARMHRIALGLSLAIWAAVFPVAAFGQKVPDLRNPAGEEWLTIGGDWHNTRYSTLT
jgi:hypothetical protein